MKNEIFVHTEKGQYVGGEWVVGTVFLCIHKPIPARAVRLEIVGYEKVWWQDTKTEWYEEDGVRKTRQVVIDRHASHDFFKNKFDLTSYPGGFPVGQFSYPFRYQLPSSLPGVFCKKSSGYRAKIAYKVKALVDIPHAHDLKTKQHLTINEKLDVTIQPKHHSKQITVRTLCCIPRGPVRCEAYMDKNAYMAGETAKVHVDVQNDSTVEVSHFNTKLVREITLRDHSGNIKTLRDVICVAKYPGTAPSTQRSSDCPLPLVSPKNQSFIHPATSGKYIRCEYYVMIELDIPWAPDLEIHSPVVIYAPQNTAWAQWQAPAWIATAVQQPVLPELTVPVEYLQQHMAVQSQPQQYHNNNNNVQISFNANNSNVHPNHNGGAQISMTLNAPGEFSAHKDLYAPSAPGVEFHSNGVHPQDVNISFNFNADATHEKTSLLGGGV